MLQAFFRNCVDEMKDAIQKLSQANPGESQIQVLQASSLLTAELKSQRDALMINRANYDKFLQSNPQAARTNDLLEQLINVVAQYIRGQQSDSSGEKPQGALSSLLSTLGEEVQEISQQFRDVNTPGADNSVGEDHTTRIGGNADLASIRQHMIKLLQIKLKEVGDLLASHETILDHRWSFVEGITRTVLRSDKRKAATAPGVDDLTLKLRINKESVRGALKLVHKMNNFETWRRNFIYCSTTTELMALKARIDGSMKTFSIERLNQMFHQYAQAFLEDCLKYACGCVTPTDYEEYVEDWGLVYKTYLEALKLREEDLPEPAKFPTAASIRERLQSHKLAHRIF